MVSGITSASAGAISKTSSASAGSINKKRIIVIGAGLAGLAAARELKKHGHDIVVLEARDRIGGRIWTSDRWSDIPLDMGATWIHGVKGNPITALANEISAKRLITSYDKTATYASKGHILSKAEESRIERLSKQVFEILGRAQNSDTDLSIADAIKPLLQANNGSDDVISLINFILSGQIEQEYAGSINELSTHWYDGAKSFEGDDALFAEGFEIIIDYLAKGTKKIELNQIVNEINWQDSQVKIVTNRGEYIADQVIVTLPLGVLKTQSVRFVPDLPLQKITAIQKIGMGVLNKCYLRFSEVFWPKNIDWLEYIPSQHGRWTEWVSFKRAANQPILLGFNAANRGREIEALEDHEIVASAMETLKTIFGREIPDPIDYQITRWASDPFAL
ncbi:FAD-dependent oxidoreductase [Deefgea sp. CFH1-16]|nr:FAD-dependent oxidoreductase [Deefgea sp. CFH1-16]